MIELYSRIRNYRFICQWRIKPMMNSRRCTKIADLGLAQPSTSDLELGLTLKNDNLNHIQLNAGVWNVALQVSGMKKIGSWGSK